MTDRRDTIGAIQVRAAQLFSLLPTLTVPHKSQEDAVGEFVWGLLKIGELFGPDGVMCSRCTAPHFGQPSCLASFQEELEGRLSTKPYQLSQLEGRAKQLLEPFAFGGCVHPGQVWGVPHNGSCANKSQQSKHQLVHSSCCTNIFS